MISKIAWYGKSEQCVSISIESENAPLNDKAINKALMIAMNYLMENMKTEDQESAD